MKRTLAVAALLALPGLAMAGNFATCLLDELPGTQNDNAAGAAYQVCSGKYPARYDGVAQGSGRGFFGYDSGAECALAKAKDTRSNRASGMIRVACNRLYNPAPTGLFDDLKSSKQPTIDADARAIYDVLPYSFFNPSSVDFDRKAVEAVISLRQSYVSRGMSQAAALKEAAHDVSAQVLVRRQAEDSARQRKQSGMQ